MSSDMRLVLMEEDSLQQTFKGGGDVNRIVLVFR